MTRNHTERPFSNPDENENNIKFFENFNRLLEVADFDSAGELYGILLLASAISHNDKGHSTFSMPEIKKALSERYEIDEKSGDLMEYVFI